MGNLLTRLREAVAVSSEPQLQRGSDTDDQANGKKKRGKKPKEQPARESFRILLREANITKGNGGAYEVTIVREGPGNPGDRNYYTKQALREAVKSGLFEGLQAYLNHPTPDEERQRPERDVRYLAGHFREARYVDGNPAEVRAKFIPGGMDKDGVVSLVESALEGMPLGISIDGFGHAPDTINVGGKEYNAVREVTHLGSADIVTRAGAGGKFHRRLQEAWKLTERDFNAKQRKAAKKSGAAMDDGSYPIYNQEDADNAWELRGRSKNHSEAAVVAHIRSRVKTLGLKMPGSDSTRESNPAGQAGTSKEGRMKPAKLQEQIKAAVAKLREASNIEDDDQRAGTLIQEALTELDECATAEIKAGKKVEIREVEKPVAAGDTDADKLAAQVADLEHKLQEAEAARDEEKSRRKDAERRIQEGEQAKLAAKVLREAEVPAKSARAWFDDVVECEDEDAMKRLVERRLEEREELVSEIRESYGVEGAGARPPASAAGGSGSSGLLDRMGISRDELAA
jgi:hypothetical protein